ncbi:lipocalin-like domain-containing protein [Dyella mobilis]|uniref:Lipocalin-like domain-containing protein n=1 Tax=Dyella mobilis TaxID=1849582 RepID=A0ABS2KB71_9GAMM|nr:lipocalin-like domain-containing protein [Dyella mobilis]MBM7128113.1 lipocalin-like domain-containing protein [Dyella mobilis]GLQ99929.1 hypothetical protein GCM10007863_43490 [Dyella mobilis]
MYRIAHFLVVGALALTFAAPVAHADSAATMPSAQVPTWLAGTWTLVSCDNVYPDGHRVELYGHNPQGLWMIDAQGHYMMHIARMQRMPFASGDKSKGTAEEYRAASLDSNSHFGSVSVQGDQMTTHIVQASFPNWNGRGGSEHYTRNGNQLTYIVAKPSSGAAEGAHGEVTWQKLD